MSFLKKLSLSQGLMTLTACGAVLATGSFTTAFAQTAASSFQRSCFDISIDGDLLSATCITANGGFNRTQIRIRGIENRNGTLTFTNLNAASSFQNSCRDIIVGGDILAASCRRTNGRFSTTFIRFPGLGNNNGVLTY